MPRRSENVHSNATPHPDGKYDRIINDSMAAESSQMGVSFGNESGTQNPFRLSKTKNKDMVEFEQFMRGDSLDKE